jgi:Na+/proline symporter
MAATVASFAGLVLVLQPALVFRDGFQAPNVSALAIGIPLAGTLLMKRQWMLSKRFGYVTQGEMLSEYFQGDSLRLVSVGIAVLFAVPFTAILLGATGYIASELSGGLVSRNLAMWLLSLVVLFYVVTGGVRAVANIGVVQCVLFAGVSVIIGAVAFHLLGGFQDFNIVLGGIADLQFSHWGNTEGLGGGSYNSYFAVPGVIQFTEGLGGDASRGGPWTSVMVLSYMFALMGILSAPAFSTMGFSSKSPKAFGVHQVWLSGLCVGLIIVFFTNAQGIAAHLLGGDELVNAAKLNRGNIMPVLANGAQADILPHYITYISQSMPWMIGLLAVAAIAALHSTIAVFLTTTSGTLVRDIYINYLDPEADDSKQMLAARVYSCLLLLTALCMATYSMTAVALIGGLVLAFSFQLVPALLAVAWLPWLSRQAILLGVIAGLTAVIFTESLGQTLTGGRLPWNRWPLTIHSAGWGIFLNIAVCLVVTLSTGFDKGRAHRDKFHSFLRANATLSGGVERLKPVAWLFTLVWLFFAVGPGTVIGNDLFGAPDAGFEAWVFNMPSIWAWQIIWWVIGVGLIWFLAYKMEMSTTPNHDIETMNGSLEPIFERKVK